MLERYVMSGGAAQPAAARFPRFEIILGEGARWKKCCEFEIHGEGGQNQCTG